MKALFVESPGQEPSLVVKDIGVPEPGPHDVLVKVAACGLCHHDVAIMRGTLRRGVRPDIVLGHEISGHIVEIGEEVSSVSLDDRVTSTLTAFCGTCERCLSGREYRCFNGEGVGHGINGGFAEFVRLPESSVIRLPDGIDLIGAAILACPMGVSLQAVRDVAKVEAGESVIVTGAGGGLGVHAIQIASSLGARVIALTTSPHKLEMLESVGDVEVFLTDNEDFSELALALTEDEGADVVIDTVGSATFLSSVRSLKQFGRMVVLGEVMGERVNISLTEILFRDASVIGSTGAGRRHIEDAAKLVKNGDVKPVVSQKVALEDAIEAFQLVRDGKSFGRTVLIL